MVFHSLTLGCLVSSREISRGAIEWTKKALGLQTVLIDFGRKWEAKNPLFDWYEQHSNCTITRMQRRKERRGPFFHEYVVIELQGGNCYRIDRRPHGSADSMGCAPIKGVAADDTIEQTPSLEYSLYCSEGSDLLLDIEFHVPVQLQLLLHIFYAIHLHPKARAFSPLYNCYFFAQAIVYCTTRSVRMRHEKDTRDVKFPYSDDYWRAVTPTPEVGHPANEYFAPINGRGGQKPTYKYRGQPPKLAAGQEQKSIGYLLKDAERSNTGSIWKLRQFVCNPAHALG
ncbi:hypothetical protein FRC11_008516 [Ceratobasidium sp. 423]|nr:hypothetical protein FRC11_008516 [Ceratobasidium sp. 423]